MRVLVGRDLEREALVDGGGGRERVRGGDFGAGIGPRSVGALTSRVVFGSLPSAGTVAAKASARAIAEGETAPASSGRFLAWASAARNAAALG